MTYASASDLTSRFGEDELRVATDRDRTGLVDEAKVAAALASADNSINAAIRSRYPLPLAEVDPLLVDLACDIARYRLYPREAPPLVRERYEDAISTLAKLASGAQMLGAGGGAPADPAPAGVAFVSGDRRFSRRSLADA